jgi:hypothetical protein
VRQAHRFDSGAASSSEADHNQQVLPGCRCQVVQVDMMSRTFKSRELEGTQTISYSEVEGQYRAIRLPYKGSAGLGAVFVLPDKNKYKSVFDAAAEITGATVLDRKNWASLFDLNTLSVSVPRFKVSISQLSMTKVRADTRSLVCWLTMFSPQP